MPTHLSRPSDNHPNAVMGMATATLLRRRPHRSLGDPPLRLDLLCIPYDPLSLMTLTMTHTLSPSL